MRRHEIELITALAEGRLEDESEARALIASSPKAQASYVEQVKAIEALAELKVPMEMTSSEKAAMQRDLWTALSTSRESSAPRAERRAVGVLGYATAGIFVLGGLFVAMNVLDPVALQFGDATSDSSVMETAGSPSDPPGTSAEPRSARFSALADQARTGVLALTDIESDSVRAELSDCLERAGLTNVTVLGRFAESGVTYMVAVPENTDLDDAPTIVFIDQGSCTIAHKDD
jgi:hypothetical protein